MPSNSRNYQSPTLALFALMLFTLCAAGPTPAPKVRDDGQFFKPETVGRVDDIVGSIKQKYGWDLTIETFAEIPRNQLPRFQAEPKEVFFENWLRAEAHANKTRGVFILMVSKPGRLQVGVGRETNAAGAFSTKDRDELRDLMLKSLASRQYDEALLEGANFVLHRLEKNKAHGANVAQPPAAVPTDAPPTSASAPSPAPATEPGSGKTTLPVAPATPATAPTPTPAATAPVNGPNAAGSPATSPATAPASGPSVIPTEPKGDFSAKPDESGKPKSDVPAPGAGASNQPDTTAKPDANKTDVSPKPKSGAKPTPGSVDSNK